MGHLRRQQTNLAMTSAFRFFSSQPDYFTSTITKEEMAKLDQENPDAYIWYPEDPNLPHLRGHNNFENPKLEYEYRRAIDKPEEFWAD
mmetsp:Transcript_10722/g.16300  ORF Transcript_10722/g.16300 Transcript_10722/m.16300 type:complete len:88 (-) Transcript_10722:1987-2250(-)